MGRVAKIFFASFNETKSSVRSEQTNVLLDMFIVNSHMGLKAVIAACILILMNFKSCSDGVNDPGDCGTGKHNSAHSATASLQRRPAAAECVNNIIEILSSE